jgi:opacity protein-like surface antigen
VAEADAATSKEGEPVARSIHGTELSLEAGGAFEAGAHFPEDAAGRSVEETIDSALGFGVWIFPRSTWALGLSLERVGLGKDHYATDALGQTLNASYDVDTLWLGGRFFFSENRPAFYLGIAAGPALPRVRATGTREVGSPFAQAPQPFECSASGSVGAGVTASGGVEFDIADQWSLVGEGRAVGHFIGKSAGPFDGCAPGSGPAVGGSLRVGFSYRFEL